MMSGSASNPEDLKEYLCGWGAAFVNINVTFPINKVIFRQMLHGVEMQLAVKQLQREGLRYLYRGMMPPLIQKTVTVSIMFGTYAQYRHLLDVHMSHILHHDLHRCAIAAFMAGSTEAILTPFERVQMLLQARQYHGMYQNTFHAFGKIKSLGARECYRGLSAVLCRNGPSNILFFTLRGKVKSVMPVHSGNRWLDLVEDFLSGACVGAFISTIFYPMNVIRTKMQTCPPGSEHLSMKQAFLLVYQERNRSIRKIFYGVHVNYSRAFLSWGIINASYEFFKKLLYHPDEISDTNRARRKEEFANTSRSYSTDTKF